MSDKKLIREIGRRQAIFSAMAFVSAIAGIDTAMYASTSFSRNDEKPFLSQDDLNKRIDTIVSGIYEDARKLGFPLREDYIHDVSKEIVPEVRFITERRFVVEK
ncbi:MAG TPA: hypothetical protein VGG79_07610 [Roseiarcus sp.]